jgi:hypothetical protein
MSVQSELNRITEGKENIVASIESKGVSVPDGATIDQLSAYVDAIKSGAVTAITLNADSGTLSASDLALLKENPEDVVFVRGGFYYFAENLSSSSTWYYSCNVYYDGAKITKRVISITTANGAYSKADYNYTPPYPSAAGTDLGLVKSGGDVTVSNGVITVNDNSHNHSNYTSTSVLPNNSGEVKTKYRVAQKGDAGRTDGYYWYYKLCDLPTNDSGNYASAIISGRIGGWTSNDMSYINALVWNRGTPGISLIDIAGAATAMSTIWNTCELVLYANSANTATLYAKCYSWFTFDLDIEVFQASASITYDGTFITTTPTGTFADSCSNSTKRLELIAGGLYVNGQLTALMEDINSVYTDSQSYTDDKLKEATDYTDTRETEIKKYTDSKTQEAKRYADEKAASIVGSAPETLNALNELAAALGNDPNFATTVSNQLGQKANQADLDTMSDDVDALKGQVSGKLDKTTYEASKELALGSNGKVCLGKFGAYDTNITIELNSTTHTTYHATIVISTQNVVSNGTGGTVGCYVYDDADNHITPLVSVFRPYGSASRQIEVYADLPGWSKNLVHVQGVAISDGGMTDVLTSVDTIPTAIDGKITVTPINVLTTNFASKTELAGKANDADLKTVAKTGSYNDLTNKPSIPAAVTVDSALSNTSTNPVQNKVVNSALAGKMSIDINNGSYTNTKTYISHHPENGNGNIIPFIYNDIGHLLARGGGAACSIYTTSDTSYTPFSLTQVKTVDTSWSLFDGSPSYQNNFSGVLTGSETLVIDVTCHKTFYWSNTIYIDFGNLSWTPSSVKILTSTAGGTYTERNTATGFTSPALFVHFDSSSAGFNRIRFVLEKAKANLRIAQIGVINYGSSGATETLVSRGGSSMFGSLIPYNNYGANLGGLTNQWNSIYGGTIYEGGTALSSKYATKTDVNSKLPTSGGTITGKTTVDTTSNTDMTNPAVNILHTGPADGGAYADLMILSGFKQAPYGFKFRTHGSGTAIIQSQRINNNGETFPLSLNPNGGKVLINGSYAVNEARLQEVLGSYVNEIDALLGG